VLSLHQWYCIPQDPFAPRCRSDVMLRSQIWFMVCGIVGLERSGKVVAFVAGAFVLESFCVDSWFIHNFLISL